MDRHPRIEGELPFEAQGEGFDGHAPVRDQLNSFSAGVTPAIVPLVCKPARFAGLTYAQLGLMAVALAAAIWGMWATAKIFALEDRRVVSVRLAAIVNDFVTAEARSGTPPDQLTARTRAFMTALDSVLKKRAADGQVVLVGEAVVAASVPDVTMEVVADLAQLVKMRPPAAMPPAMAPTVMQQGAPAPGQIPPSAPEPSPDSPFGEEPGLPADLVPQP
jgi:hypothetical protein